MAWSEVQRESIRRSTQTMQIIAAALPMGVITFLVIVLFVVPPDRENQALLNTYIALGAGGLALVAAFVVPNFMRAHEHYPPSDGAAATQPGAANDPASVDGLEPLVALYQTRLITSLAILEGAAFYNLVAYMLEGQTVNLAMTGVLLGAMAFQFPTQDRLERWLADRLKSLADDRTLRVR